MKQGRVLSIYGEKIQVDAEGDLYTCVLRGILKKETSTKRNILIVGDIVTFTEISKGEGVIEKVEPRYSLLSRLSKEKQHLIAANIDQVLITASTRAPSLKTRLIDRYIIAAEKGNMTPIIVLNKIDLERPNEMIKLYRDLGYTILPVSATTGEGLEDLRKQMWGKASVFSGQSGTGKSSLINTLLDLDLSTGPIVQRTQKGKHTTTRAHLIPLEGGGWCIDTPGIKSFGVWDLQPQEIEAYFHEIHEMGKNCRFANCSHTHEPDCVVRGNVSPLRYESYLALLQKGALKR